MNEKICPICSKTITSDAEIHEFCALCGMGISDPISSLIYKNNDGKILVFCCYNCLSVYKNEIDSNLAAI